MDVLDQQPNYELSQGILIYYFRGWACTALFNLLISFLQMGLSVQHTLQCESCHVLSLLLPRYLSSSMKWADSKLSNLEASIISLPSFNFIVEKLLLREM